MKTKDLMKNHRTEEIKREIRNECYGRANRDRNSKKTVKKWI